jgi:peroxiredoxin
MEELSAINEKMESWQKDANFAMYAVSTDDAKTSQKVKTMTKSKGWYYNILMDTNQTLKRALNINTIPYTTIIYKGEIVYKHVGYSPGDEDELLAKIKELNKN